MLQFDNVPNKKPGGGSVEPGRYLAKIAEATVKTSSNNNEFLNIKFKLKEGGIVFDSLFFVDKDFPKYKIKRLLDATGVTLSSGGPDDVRKVVTGKKVEIVVTVNDKGYPEISFAGNDEGYYAVEANDPTPVESPAEQAVDSAIDTDEDF